MTAQTDVAMSSLTFEKIMEAKRRIDALHPDPFPREPNPFSLRPLGVPLIEAPDPPPKIQLSRECAELVGAEFAASVNTWLLARFGRREDIFGDKVFLLGGFGMVTSKHNAALIRNVIA